MSRREPSNLAKNLAKSFASLCNEVTALKVKLQQIEHDLIFFKELGLEKLVEQHNRDKHERELSLDIYETGGC